MIPNLNVTYINAIAVEAGSAIMEVYEKDLSGSVAYKSDNSPLTLADKHSHDVICAKLRALYPEIPVISEEGKEISYESRKNWEWFWLVDPLDGTKEFIKKNGEFTVNIALIHKNQPVVGTIYVPAKKTLYFADRREGAFMSTEDNKITSINVSRKKSEIVAIGSRSHSSEKEKSILASFGVTTMFSAGSSLKFCLIAEGVADIYYREGPTMEWDTAAGQVIVECAGGTMVNAYNGAAFLYNKPSLLNEGFLCLGTEKRTFH
jgi:3'(2'), 5'-bisphosphate nucleotidase